MLESRSRSIGVVTLGALLLWPVSASGKPFSVVAPKRVEICSSSPFRSGGDGWSWIVVGDEPFDIEDLRKIEFDHWSPHPDIQIQSQLLIHRQRGSVGRNTAFGDGDRVALAAFPRLRPEYGIDSAAWIWSWRWPEGHHGAERISTTVRIDAYDARFDTDVVFDRECDHRPKTTAAQLVTAISASLAVDPIVADIRQDPPEGELRDNRNQLLALGIDESGLVHMQFYDHPIEVVFGVLKRTFGVNAEIAHDVERRNVRFAADVAPFVDAFALFAHQESLRFEARDGTLFVLDAAEP